MRLQIAIASNDIAAVNEVLASGCDRQLLRQLRDEAATLVLMVRLENDKRKEEWKQRKAEDFSYGLFQQEEMKREND